MALLWINKVATILDMEPIFSEMYSKINILNDAQQQKAKIKDVTDECCCCVRLCNKEQRENSIRFLAMSKDLFNKLTKKMKKKDCEL